MRIDIIIAHDDSNIDHTNLIGTLNTLVTHHYTDVTRTLYRLAIFNLEVQDTGCILYKCMIWKNGEKIIGIAYVWMCPYRLLPDVMTNTIFKNIRSLVVHLSDRTSYDQLDEIVRLFTVPASTSCLSCIRRSDTVNESRRRRFLSYIATNDIIPIFACEITAATLFDDTDNFVARDKLYGISNSTVVNIHTTMLQRWITYHCVRLLEPATVFTYPVTADTNCVLVVHHPAERSRVIDLLTRSGAILYRKDVTDYRYQMNFAPYGSNNDTYVCTIEYATDEKCVKTMLPCLVKFSSYDKLAAGIDTNVVSIILHYSTRTSSSDLNSVRKILDSAASAIVNRTVLMVESDKVKKLSKNICYAISKYSGIICSYGSRREIPAWFANEITRAINS